VIFIYVEYEKRVKKERIYLWRVNTTGLEIWHKKGMSYGGSEQKEDKKKEVIRGRRKYTYHRTEVKKDSKRQRDTRMFQRERICMSRRPNFLHSGHRAALYNAKHWYWHWVSFQIRSDIGNQLTATVMIIGLAGAEWQLAYSIWYCLPICTEPMVGRETQFVQSLHKKFSLRPQKVMWSINWLEWSAICDDAFQVVVICVHFAAYPEDYN
jgi:hypothetical protein